MYTEDIRSNLKFILRIQSRVDTQESLSCHLNTYLHTAAQSYGRSREHAVIDWLKVYLHEQDVQIYMLYARGTQRIDMTS